MGDVVLLDETGARELTERIKASAEATWELLLEAYERRAWAVLGYPSWREYATIEFGMSQSRAYQLLDQARVIGALGEAAGDSTDVEITEAAARDIRDEIDVVADLVRERTADLEPEQVRATVQAIVDEYRQRQAARRERYRTEGPVCEPAVLFRAVSTLANLPPPSEVVEELDESCAHRLDGLPDAVSWLTAFNAMWKRRKRASAG